MLAVQINAITTVRVAWYSREIGTDDGEPVFMAYTLDESYMPIGIADHMITGSRASERFKFDHFASWVRVESNVCFSQPVVRLPLALPTIPYARLVALQSGLWWDSYVSQA
jgi:hypothetical protein